MLMPIPISTLPPLGRPPVGVSGGSNEIVGEPWPSARRGGNGDVTLAGPRDREGGWQEADSGSLGRDSGDFLLSPSRLVRLCRVPYDRRPYQERVGRESPSRASLTVLDK